MIIMHYASKTKGLSQNAGRNLEAKLMNTEKAAHVVKDYTNKAKTDMFLPLSES